MGKRVMVIDDDRGIRSFLEKALAAKGMEADVANRGAVGLQKILAGDYDLALIDINMPEISGPAICSALRKQKKTLHLPVVMMTAMFHSTDQIEQAKEEYGATEFLLKPFKVEDLYWLIDSLFPEEKVPADRVKKLEGKLREHSLPILLNQLYSQKATGLLDLRREETRKVIYLKGGYPIFARSNILGECLGRMLVKDNVISPQQCDESIERSKVGGRLQGTVLIEMGLLSPEELHEALARQITEKLLSVFLWSDGEYQFSPTKNFKKNVTEIELSPAALIYQGVSRYWSSERLIRYLDPYRQDFICQAKDPLFRFQEMGLNRRGEAIFEDCLGDLTLEKILHRYPLSRREVQQTLASLLLAGMVSVSATAATLDQSGQEKRRKEKPQDEKLREKILDDYHRILQADYYSALGVARNGNLQDVRRAYYALVKEFHPDRYLGLGLSQDMEEKVNEIFQYLTHAYSVLSDKETRASYLDELVNGPKQTIDVKTVIQAETAFQRGRTLLKVRRYREAAEHLRKAVEMCAKEPEYMTQYAWAVYKSEPKQLDAQNKALEILIASRELNPRLDETYLYLGYVYRALKKDRRSEKSFELAVQVNPHCTEALRELRLINLRKEQSGGGIFRKFLGKKKD
ncbi:MAG TPA: response regulator [Geopsychrobacteraceae bacterium]|nr:response regulator [Geopsychrobacteraceae bacterium]